MTGRKRRLSHGGGVGVGYVATNSPGLSRVGTVTAVLVAALTITSSSPFSDQHEEADSISTTGTRSNHHTSQHVGEALNLPIDEPPTDQNGDGDGNKDQRFFESKLAVPHLQQLAEERFVQSFQDMFDGQGNIRYENEESPAEENDAILCLFAIYSPDCRACEPMLRGLNHVSGRIGTEYDEVIAPRWDTSTTSSTDTAHGRGRAAPPTPPPPLRPVLGMLNGSNVTRGFYTKLEPLTVYPSLKFALVQRQAASNDGDENEAREESKKEDAAAPKVAIQIFDYVGPSAHTMNDLDGLTKAIWHYWYRYVAARRTNMARTIDAFNEHVEQQVALQSPPVFLVPSVSSAISFLKKHGDSILRSVPVHIPVQLNEEERLYYSDLLQTTPEEEEAGLGEPVTIFVQCRPHQDDDTTDAKTEKRFYSKFDGLAEELVNRRDVAFFAVQPPNGHGCDDRFGWFGDDGIGYGAILDGTIAALRTTDVSLIQDDKPVALYVPPTAGEIAKDAMTQFVITHTTPTLLLFDRNFAADYAFPFYRTLHAVLFIDTPELGKTFVGNEKRLKRNEDILGKSRRAIRLFREAAIHHRRHRSSDDIVFIIVPSYEKRVFNLFGVDIWTGLDRKFSAARNVALSIDKSGDAAEEDATKITKTEQSCEAEDEVVPTLMLTSRSSPTNRSVRVVTKRYYLPAVDILHGNDSRNEDTEKSVNVEGKNNVISRFIDRYFAGDLQPAIQSQPTPTNRTNDDGVQLLTGNTFKPLVVDRKKRHALVNFFSATCGHSKRFNVIWNQLGRLVRALDWHDMVDVMKMDLTRNELPLDNVSVWEYPSVYYFPANEKENAIPMKVEGDAVYGDLNLRGYDLVEWLINQDKFDEKELMELHGLGSASLSGTGESADGGGAA